MTRYKDKNAKLAAKVLDHKKWIVFPWERKRYWPYFKLQNVF